MNLRKIRRINLRRNVLEIEKFCMFFNDVVLFRKSFLFSDRLFIKSVTEMSVVTKSRRNYYIT